MQVLESEAQTRNQAEEESERIDALEKVLGKTRYTTDMIAENVLYLRTVMSPHAHALIKAIDTRQAEQIEGVVRVLTAKDVPGTNDIGYLVPDQQLFCKDKVRFIGDAVAMVVAESPEAAELGLQAVRVDYEPLPGIFNAKDALEPDAIKIHAKGNVLARHFVRNGDVEEGLGKADLVIKGTFKTPVQEHAYLETEASLAFYSDSDTITVVGGMQYPFAVEKCVKEVLGKAGPKVRIVQAPTGGSFGGKESTADEMCARAALATFLTKRPTILALSREESIVYHPKRHPMTIEREMGVTKEGKITAVRAKLFADGGAYASLSPAVLFHAVCLNAGAYEVPNVLIEGVVTYTNNAPTGAFRGFGKPQTFFSAETQMDEAAEKLGLDPLELRRRNILRVGSTTATGQLLKSSVGLEECLQRAIEASGWKTKHTPPGSKSGVRRRGIGMACSIHGTSMGAMGNDVATAKVEVAGDGSLLVLTGLTEYGQGIHTGYAKIVSRMLGLARTRVKVELPDTTTALDSGPTVASRGTAMGGKALFLATQKIKEKMAAVAAEILSSSASEIVFANDEARLTGSPGRSIGFPELAAECRRRGVELKEAARIQGTGAVWDKEKGRGSPWSSYSFAVHVAEVEVDTETGKVDVINYVAAHDSGRVLVPAQFRSQIYGGVVQGLGYVLMEELIIEKGRILNTGFLDYYMPTAADIGSIRAIVVEAPDENSPIGAKGIGEPPIEPVAAAVGNAVYNALGFPIREFPYTPERVRTAIAAREA